MKRRRVHILYEYGPDLRPHGSAYIRLLRPFGYPTVSEYLDVTHGLRYDGREADVVIVDRLWRPDISHELASGLVEEIRRSGAQFVYALDDNLLDLPVGRRGRLTDVHVQIVRFFLVEADGVIVTTQRLRKRLEELNSDIVVVPNALDERLLIPRVPLQAGSPFGPRPKVVGYMGTFTHDEDLLMVLPALERVCQRYPGQVELELVGGVRRAETLEVSKAVRFKKVGPNPEEIEYPLFMLWFSSRVRWDIAICPLRDTAFDQCKSDIKFLDYSAVGAAGIYSRVPAYESSVRHLETGLLTENDSDAWMEALEMLIQDDSLRIDMSQNATQYLYKQRVLARCALDWVKRLDQLVGGA